MHEERCSHCIASLRPGYSCIHLYILLLNLLPGPIFGHSATTQGGSSGCPIFRGFEGRWVIIGLHRGEIPVDAETVLTNVATHLSVIYDAYMNKLNEDLGMLTTSLQTVTNECSCN